jgi:hypothetical protein
MELRRCQLLTEGQRPQSMTGGWNGGAIECRRPDAKVRTKPRKALPSEIWQFTGPSHQLHKSERKT